jgi:YidC/Oxa1 family membrane protein insertase
MEKRVIVAIALCIGVLVVWTQLFSPPPPAPKPPAPVAADGGQAAGTPAAPTAAAPGPNAAAPAPVVNRPERQVELTTPEVNFVFSSLGATLVHARLREAQFIDDPPDKPVRGHDVVRAVDAKEAPFRLSFPKAAFAPPGDGAWEVSQPAPDTVVFSADSGTTHIEKRFRADKTRYRLHLDVVIANRGEAPVDHNLAIAVTGRQDPNKRGGGIFSAVSANVASVVCDVNGEVERESIEGLEAKAPKDGAIRWIATDEKFFLLAAVPYPEPAAQPGSPPPNRSCIMSPLGPDLGQVLLSFSGRTVPPRGETIYPFTIFAGPKFIDDLKQVRPPLDRKQAQIAGPEVGLDEAVDVTLAMLSRPILEVMKFFHRFTHNWGLAIVLLTIFIKLLTFYPTQKSLISGKRMQKLAPKMAAIRKKFENDRQRMSQETMNLYKSHGVSPVGGCLPMLIQMPIWIALYSTLNYAVELYRAPFFAHIHDLTAKDPFYITPLVMGGVMVLQMRMSPAGADKQQQAIMSVMMPIMFTVFSLFLPSGLAVYMLTSYLIGIVQQLYVNHLDRKGAIGV